MTPERAAVLWRRHSWARSPVRSAQVTAHPHITCSLVMERFGGATAPSRFTAALQPAPTARAMCALKSGPRMAAPRPANYERRRSQIAADSLPDAPLSLRGNEEMRRWSSSGAHRPRMEMARAAAISHTFSPVAPEDGRDDDRPPPTPATGRGVPAARVDASGCGDTRALELADHLMPKKRIDIRADRI